MSDSERDPPKDFNFGEEMAGVTLVSFLKTLGAGIAGGLVTKMFGREETVVQPYRDDGRIRELESKVEEFSRISQEKDILINNLENKNQMNERDKENLTRNYERVNEEKERKLDKKDKQLAEKDKEMKIEVEKREQEIMNKNIIIENAKEENNQLSNELKRTKEEKEEIQLNNKNLKRENKIQKQENAKLQRDNDILINQNTQLNEENKIKDNQIKEKNEKIVTQDKIIAEQNEVLKKIEEEEKQKNKQNEEAQKKFLNEREKLTKELMKKLIETLHKEMIDYCENIKIDEDSMKSLEEKIIQSKKEMLIENCKQLIKNVNLDGEKIQHFNILIIGREGVGKSALINNLLYGGEVVSPEGIGEGVTKEFIPYPKPEDWEGNSSEKEKTIKPVLEGIRLWDSKGLNQSYSSDKAIEKIKEKIKENEEKLDQVINCIWYCVAYDRFNREELKDFLLEISSEYERKIPFFILYLKAYDKKLANEMIEEIREVIEKVKGNENLDNDIKKVLEKVEIIDIISKKYDLNGIKESTTYQRNLPLLLNKTINEIDKAFSITCYHLLTKKIIKIYAEEIKKKNLEISNYIKNDIFSNVFNDSENLIYEEMFSKIYPIFYDISKMFLGEELDKNKVDDYVKKYFEKIEKDTKKIVEDYVKEKTELTSNNIASKILELQSLIDAQYNENMKNKKSKKEILDEIMPDIKIKLNNIIKILFIKIYFSKILEKLIDSFDKKLVGAYRKLLKNDLSKQMELINDNIKSKFVKNLKEKISKSFDGYKANMIKKINKEKEEVEKEIKKQKNKNNEDEDDE